MNRLSTLFIKTGLLYLAISTVLGILIIIGPGFSFIHGHLSLIGWISFLIFGICYETVPRFTGRPIFSEKLGIMQFWLANIGLFGLSLSYPSMRMSMLKGYDYFDALMTVVIFGVIEAVSIFMFILNIWKSMNRADQ